MKLKKLIFISAFIATACSNPLGTNVSVQAPYAPTQNGTPDLAPTITSVSPTTGPILGGTKITITGTNFVTNTAVIVDGQICPNLVLVSATKITCTTLGHISGWVNIQVSNSSTLLAVLTNAFDYVSGSNPYGNFGVASGGGVSTGTLKLRGSVGGLASQISPSGPDMIMYPGLINVTVSH